LRFTVVGNRALETDCLHVIANARIHLRQLAAAFATAQSARTLSIEIENR